MDNANAAVQGLNAGAHLTDTFTVTTVDGTQQTVTVTINGTNDAPTAPVDINAATNTVNPNAAIGTVVGIAANSTDPDTGDTVTYALTSNPGGLFAINSSTGVVTVANSVNLVTGTYTIGVDAIDNHNLQSSVTSFTIAVADTTSPTASVSHSLSASKQQATFTVTASDAGGIQTVQLIEDGTTVIGTATGNAGTYTFTFTAGNPGFLQGSTHIITAKVIDTSNNSITVSDPITVTLNNLANTKFLTPAGISGEAINLGLTDHVAGDILHISGLQAGWSLSEGTKNADGTWTVISNHISDLSVTSATGYVGALVLAIEDQSTNADGSIQQTLIADNVEAYANGAPIFAVSTADHLTGSSGNDNFIFAGPIGVDTINNFDVAHDHIDLVQFAGIDSFAAIQAHLANDGLGNAIITLGDGQTISLLGVDAASLNASNFQFDQVPVTDNSGIMTISDGAIMPLAGVFNNSGTVELSSTGDTTSLEIIQHGLVLNGAGHVVLSDSSENQIFGTGTDVTLTNVDNIISGAGQFGVGELNLVNEGTINASGTHALVIDTGANAVINSGTLEASNSGGLLITGDLVNSGLIWANNGNVDVIGNVTGNGTALIEGAALLEFGGASDAQVTFGDNSLGTLKLDHSVDFNGMIFGLKSGEKIDLSDINFGTGVTSIYTANGSGSGGTLTVTDGTHTANIALSGTQAVQGYSVASDGHAGTVITFDPLEVPLADLHRI